MPGYNKIIGKTFATPTQKGQTKYIHKTKICSILILFDNECNCDLHPPPFLTALNFYFDIKYSQNLALNRAWCIVSERKEIKKKYV